MDKQAYEAPRRLAREKLLRNGSDLGLLGSSQAYQQVWARDSMLCGLGLMECGEEGRRIHRNSLESLRAYQSPLGKIPHNVGRCNVPDPALIAHGGRLMSRADGQDVDAVMEDTCHAGCVDGNLLYILGHYHYYEKTKDEAFLRTAWPSLEKALLWLRYQDSNECGLLEVHEAMDWADLYANRYNVLFDNVLYCAAWRAMGLMARALGKAYEAFEEQAEDVRRKIDTLMWIGAEEPKNYEWIAANRKEWLYPLRRMEAELVERPFYMPYVAFRDFTDRFDTLGNLLAIVYGVADQVKADKILDYIDGCGLNQPFPVRAVYPPIQPGEKDWRDYYRVRNLNLPDHYHNGGAWPFIGGIYVMALVKAGRLLKAEEQYAALTEMNRRGKNEEWEFNEWFHGISGQPMGYGGQSWSLAMYLAAGAALEAGDVPVFTRGGDWGLRHA